jgi:hypothetical protein
MAWNGCATMTATRRIPVLRSNASIRQIDVDKAGNLSLHVAAAISTPLGHRDIPLDYDHLETLRDEYSSADTTVDMTLFAGQIVHTK